MHFTEFMNQITCLECYTNIQANLTHSHLQKRYVLLWKNRNAGKNRKPLIPVYVIVVVYIQINKNEWTVTWTAIVVCDNWHDEKYVYMYILRI